MTAYILTIGQISMLTSVSTIVNLVLVHYRLLDLLSRTPLSYVILYCTTMSPRLPILSCSVGPTFQFKCNSFCIQRLDIGAWVNCTGQPLFASSRNAARNSKPQRVRLLSCGRYCNWTGELRDKGRDLGWRTICNAHNGTRRSPENRRVDMDERRRAHGI